MEKPRLFVIIKKTLIDLFTIKTTGLYLGLMLLLPILFAMITKSENLLGLNNMTLEMQAAFITGLFIVMAFLWTAGFPLVLFTFIKCAGFISKEDADGTLLILVSKPIKRSNILLGKFLAFLIYTLTLQLIVLLLIPYIWTQVYGLDLFVFSSLLKVVLPIFIYSTFVLLIFGSIASALSTVTKNSVKIITILVVLTIFLFFGFSMVRNFTVSTGLYERYNIYAFDINYHLGNTYDFFIEQSNIKIMPFLQIPLGGFSGIYDVNQQFIDFDQGIMAPSLQKYSYFSPIYSIILWLALASGLVLSGIFLLKKKEIF